MVAAALMLVVLVCSYLAMIALVEFAEHVIERPRVAARNHSAAKSSEKPMSH
jgi:hypothetical protein